MAGTDADGDILPDARTVRELVTAVNARYGLDLPVSFPDGTVLERLWRVALLVREGTPPILYEALAIESFTFAAIDGKAHITINASERQPEGDEHG